MPQMLRNGVTRTHGVARFEWLLFLLLSAVAISECMTDSEIRNFREQSRDIFTHGFDNYMTHAFPEDELRPLSCEPLTRDRHNPAHIEVNDVLGNYSLTLIDALSTLAILASTPPENATRNLALSDFQLGVELLVENYGDGTTGAGGAGDRARGFDLDSKVQVFETVIRGVGGLLSAHLFAVGDLPIRGYHPSRLDPGSEDIVWDNGFVYNGQLLRLAQDLGNRMLPAFNTPTGLPYPRVNLQSGIPFYASSALNMDAENGQCRLTENDGGHREVTETCSAGAGSLVLEFTTLSRLTGDNRFEIAAKNAFLAVWSRRTSAGLIGSGIDAETGNWVHGYTGIGAGIDSFFEYAFKSHILLSGLEPIPGLPLDTSEDFRQIWDESHDAISRHIYKGSVHHHPHYVQVDVSTGASRAFWIDSLSAFYPGLLTLAGELEEAVKTHLLYAALWTRYAALPERWSSASGAIEHGLTWWGGRPEFIESTWYLYRATKDPFYLHIGEMAVRDIKWRCWTECGWAGLQNVESGEQSDRMESFFLGETAKYLFLLFDPYHPLNHLDAPWVMTTEGHPLIIPERLRMSRSSSRNRQPKKDRPTNSPTSSRGSSASPAICPRPPSQLPFSISVTAARSDIFHAGSLARLHLAPRITSKHKGLNISMTRAEASAIAEGFSRPSSHIYYPWTLPSQLIPHNATSSKLSTRNVFDLSFPTQPGSVFELNGLQRIDNSGILIKSLNALKLSMVKVSDTLVGEAGNTPFDIFRVHSIANVALGRDEKVFLPRDVAAQFNADDPHFARIVDPQVIDMVVDIGGDGVDHSQLDPKAKSSASIDYHASIFYELEHNLEIAVPTFVPNGHEKYFHMLRDVDNLTKKVKARKAEDERRKTAHAKHPRQRIRIPATLATGPGAARLPPFDDAPFELPPPQLLPQPQSSDPSVASSGPKPKNTASSDSGSPTASTSLQIPPTDLILTSIYILDAELCPGSIAKRIIPSHVQVLVIRRGTCSFRQKMDHLPQFFSGVKALALVVVVDFDEPDDDADAATSAQPQAALDEEGEDDEPLPRFLFTSAPATQPFLEARSEPDEGEQRPGGRKKPLAIEGTPERVGLLMVKGGYRAMEVFRRAHGVGLRRRLWYESQGVRIENLVVL